MTGSACGRSRLAVAINASPIVLIFSMSCRSARASKDSAKRCTLATTSSGGCAWHHAVKPTRSTNRTATSPKRRGSTRPVTLSSATAGAGKIACRSRRLASARVRSRRDAPPPGRVAAFFRGRRQSSPRGVPARRLRQIVLRTLRDAAYYAALVGQRRDHDHWDVPPRLVRLHAPKHRVAVEPGHHDVEQDKVERFVLEPL